MLDLRDLRSSASSERGAEHCCRSLGYRTVVSTWVSCPTLVDATARLPTVLFELLGLRTEGLFLSSHTEKMALNAVDTDGSRVTKTMP